MARGRVAVEGLRDLERALAEIEKHTTRRTPARNALKKAAAPLAARMVALAPDDPSSDGVDLKRSIGVGTRLTRRQGRLHRRDVKRSGGVAGELVEVFVGVGEAANAYAHLQEFGSSVHGAQPFARPAWYGEKAGVLADLVKHFRIEVGKAVTRARTRAAKLRG